MSISDILYAFTEWLRETPLTEASLAISDLPISLWIGTHFWIIPIMQTLHILALTAAFGSVLMINLHILGLTGRSRTLAQTVHRFQPWIWWALVVYQATLARNMVQWDMTLKARAGVRLSAAGLILLWCMIMFAGRWIAYAPV